MIYAQALYAAAEDAGMLGAVSAELQALKSAITKAPHLEIFLVSPTVPFPEKRKVIEGALSDFSTITKNFLLVIVDRRRAQLLAAIVEAFARVEQDKAGIAPVEVQSARPLDDNERERLAGVLQKKLNRRIHLEEHVRPELLGGLVLRHEDKMWDSSLVHALNGMRETLTELKLGAIKWKENGQT